MTTGIQNSRYKPAKKCLGPKTLQAPCPSRGQISETPRDQEGGEDSYPCNNLPTPLEQKGLVQILSSTINETSQGDCPPWCLLHTPSPGSVLLWADPLSPRFTFPSQRTEWVQRSNGQQVENIPAVSPLTPPPTLFQRSMRLPWASVFPIHKMGRSMVPYLTRNK